MTPRAKRGLTRRLGRDLLLQAVYISVAALVGVFAVAILLEDVLIKQALRGEADYYWERRATHPGLALPDTRNMIGYRDGVGDGVPDALRDLPPGFHGQDDPEAIAYVSERDGERLYLVFDSIQVSNLIALFGLMPLALVLIVVYVALYGAYRVSRRAVSPVIALAGQVQKLDPAAPDTSLFSAEHVPLVDSDEEVRVLSSAMQGLTERLAAFAERERNFTRDASHELRSPLTVIKMAAGLLRKEPELGASGQTAVGRIRQAADDMEELTEAFLLLARESGDELAGDWVSVNDIVAGEVERARLLAQGKDVAIETGAACRLLVVAPEKVLASVIGNLLRNGLSYTDSGKVAVHIDSDRIVIEDTGPGMSPGDVAKVFKPFYRAQRQRGGHGVGLTIVKRLSDRFGWPVDIESELGAGTRVTVRFPESRHEALNSQNLHGG